MQIPLTPLVVVLFAVVAPAMFAARLLYLTRANQNTGAVGLFRNASRLAGVQSGSFSVVSQTSFPMNHNDHIEETIRNIYHAFEHPGTHPLDSGLTAVDGWIASLDGIGGSALAGIQSGLRTLRGHIEQGDRAAIAASLQQLGQETSVIAHDLRGGDGDHLRHLGQALVVASGNLKVS